MSVCQDMCLMRGLKHPDLGLYRVIDVRVNLAVLGFFLVSFLSVGVHWGTGGQMGTNFTIPSRGCRAAV